MRAAALTRDRTRAFVFPLAIYAATRVLFLGITASARILSQPRVTLAWFMTRWDASYYVTLAQRGYPHGDVLDAKYAFFPAYPLSLRAVDRILPHGTIIAGVLLSLTAGAVAVVALWQIATIMASRDVADRTVVLFCLFPGTVVFAWPYADAMLLAFMCLSILALLRGHWLLASVAAACATATRPSGLALVLPCAWVAWAVSDPSTVRRLLRAGIAVAVSISGFAAYMLWLWAHTGDTHHWFRVERTVFGEGTPWKRLPTTIADTFRHGATFARVMVLVLVAVAVVLLVVGLLASQPWWAKFITVFALYLAITANIATGSPRMQLAAVPAFVALAGRLRRETLWLWCGASAALAAILIYTYGLTLLVAP